MKEDPPHFPPIYSVRRLEPDFPSDITSKTTPTKVISASLSAPILTSTNTTFVFVSPLNSPVAPGLTSPISKPTEIQSIPTTSPAIILATPPATHQMMFPEPQSFISKADPRDRQTSTTGARPEMKSLFAGPPSKAGNIASTHQPPSRSVRGLPKPTTSNPFWRNSPSIATPPPHQQNSTAPNSTAWLPSTCGESTTSVSLPLRCSFSTSPPHLPSRHRSPA